MRRSGRVGSVAIGCGERCLPEVGTTLEDKLGGSSWHAAASCSPSRSARRDRASRPMPEVPGTQTSRDALEASMSIVHRSHLRCSRPSPWLQGRQPVGAFDGGQGWPNRKLPVMMMVGWTTSAVPVLWAAEGRPPRHPMSAPINDTAHGLLVIAPRGLRPPRSKA